MEREDRMSRLAISRLCERIRDSAAGFSAKTAAIDLPNRPAAVTMEGTITWRGGHGFSRARYKFIRVPAPSLSLPRVRIYSFRSPFLAPPRPFSPPSAPSPRCPPRTPSPRDAFNILQCRSGPQWVKLASPGHLPGVWKYLQEFQIEFNAGAEGEKSGGGRVVACVVRYRSQKPHRVSSLACFTQRYVRHEPCIFTFFSSSPPSYPIAPSPSPS